VSRRPLVAALIVLLATLLSGCAATEPAFTVWQAPSPAAPDPRIGVTRVPPAERVAAPVIAGTTLSGAEVSTAELAGRVIVVNAWASWCPPCVAELPLLADVDRRYTDTGVTVLGLTVEDTPQAARDLAARSGLTFESIVDADGRILAAIPGVPPKALPSTIVIDAAGRIAARIVGPLRPGVLDGLLAEELARSRL